MTEVSHHPSDEVLLRVPPRDRPSEPSCSLFVDAVRGDRLRSNLMCRSTLQAPRREDALLDALAESRGRVGGALPRTPRSRALARAFLGRPAPSRPDERSRHRGDGVAPVALDGAGRRGHPGPSPSRREGAREIVSVRDSRGERTRTVGGRIPEIAFHDEVVGTPAAPYWSGGIVAAREVFFKRLGDTSVRTPFGTHPSVERGPRERDQLTRAGRAWRAGSRGFGSIRMDVCFKWSRGLLASLSIRRDLANPEATEPPGTTPDTSGRIPECGAAPRDDRFLTVPETAVDDQAGIDPLGSRNHGKRRSVVRSPPPRAPRPRLAEPPARASCAK